MRRIDMHAHVIGPRYLEALTRATGARPPLPPAGLAQLESMMGDYRIDAAVISTGPPGASGADQDPVAEVARVANEEIAEIVHDARAVRRPGPTAAP